MSSGVVPESGHRPPSSLFLDPVWSGTGIRNDSSKSRCPDLGAGALSGRVPKDRARGKHGRTPSAPHPHTMYLPDNKTLMSTVGTYVLSGTQTSPRVLVSCGIVLVISGAIDGV